MWFLNLRIAKVIVLDTYKVYQIRQKAINCHQIIVLIINILNDHQVNNEHQEIKNDHKKIVKNISIDYRNRI